MWPRRYYPARMFAPRYFPQSQGGAAVVIVTHAGTYERPDRGALYERPTTAATYERPARTPTYRRLT